LNISQNHFHLPDRTSWVSFSLARRRISLAPGNRTTVNVEPWHGNWIYNYLCNQCSVLKMKILIYWSNQILELIFIWFWIKTEKYTGPNKVLLFLGRRTGAYLENWMPITTKVVSSNPVHGEVYSIQHNVIKVYQWLAIGQWFSPCSPVSSTNKTNRHDISEILLKVALNTININLYHTYCMFKNYFILNSGWFFSGFNRYQSWR
jgi:hypothetical protein